VNTENAHSRLLQLLICK